MSGKVVSRNELDAISSRLKSDGKKIVTTNGCFDILHVGHVRILQQARALGDVLIVGMNSDASVRRLKGETRPINNENDRAEILCALRSVDFVCIFDEQTPIEFLKAARPDIHVKGSDYKPSDLEETPVVKSMGGEVRILDLVPLRSTTALVDKIRQS